MSHFLAGEPLALADKFALHLADKRKRAAKAHEAETQEVEDESRDGNFASGVRRGGVHGDLLLRPGGVFHYLRLRVEHML